jgi:hypothetical protein
VKTKIAIPLTMALVAAVGFVVNAGCGRGPRVVDEVIYEPTAERLVLVVQATTREGQTGEWPLDLNLETPQFGESLRKGATTFGITGQCRPMVTGEYMLEVSLSSGTETRPPDPAHGVAWRGRVKLGDRYSAETPSGGAMTFTLSKPSRS